MARAIALRADFDAPSLRRLARRSKEAAQSRRLLALAAIYEGGTRSEAARLGSVTLQIVRDWVMRFNAEGPEGLRDRKAPGPTARLTAMHRQALAAQIDRGPIPAVHGVVRWRLCDLGQWLWEAFRVSVSPQTLSRELRAMGYRKLDGSINARFALSEGDGRGRGGSRRALASVSDGLVRPRGRVWRSSAPQAAARRSRKTSLFML